MATIQVLETTYQVLPFTRCKVVFDDGCEEEITVNHFLSNCQGVTLSEEEQGVIQQGLDNRLITEVQKHEHKPEITE